MVKVITREEVINRLESRGYHAIASDVVKNGVNLEGITIRTERDVAPCFYLSDFVERFDNVEDIVEQMINLYESKKSVSFDISLFSNREWILNNVYIAVQKSSSEPLIKKPTDYENIEQFLYIRGGNDEENWSVKLNVGILANANISLEEAWDAGKNNTFAPGQTVIKSMVEVLSEMMGCNDFLDIGNEIPMYVITNPLKTKGAAQFLDKNALLNFFKSLTPLPSKIILIPSSVHEIIAVPTSDDEIDLDSFASMIREVNESQVAPTEQLGNRAYVIKL